jgi:hypothetical protein
MQNWMQRLAIFAVLGAVLSSAVLMGCGGGDAEGEATGTATPAADAGGGDE